MDQFTKLGPGETTPFDNQEGREWWNDEEKAREAAAQFGMTPEEMAASGMHPDGTPYESGPASEDPTQDEAAFAEAVGNLGEAVPEQGR